MVCLPSFGLDRHATAAAVEPAVADYPGVRRVYLDLPGVGDSPAGPATAEAVVAESSVLLERELGSQPYLLLGWSYGGYLACALARRRSPQPDGLFLICPPGPRFLPSEQRILPPPRDKPPDWVEDVPAELRDDLTLALETPSASVAASVARLVTGSRRDEDYLERLRAAAALEDEAAEITYSQPVCIVTGRQDRIGGYVQQLELLERYPHATFAVIDGAGHFLPFERPALFRSLLRTWLDRCLHTEDAATSEEQRPGI